MQIPYHLKDSLPNYYLLMNSGEWEHPDFSDKCPLCGGQDCARYHGTYQRGAESPKERFSVTDLPIIRILCLEKGDKKKCDHRTVSLLPLELIPYRKLSLKFMILAVFIKLQTGIGRINVLSKIEKVLVKLADIAQFLNEWSLYQWEILAREAFKRFIESDFSKSSYIPNIIKSDDPQERMIEFLKLSIVYKSEYIIDPIRGPDNLAFDFFQSQDGSGQLGRFLFGVASQHRKKGLPSHGK